MAENYNKIKTHEEKQIFDKAVRGRIFKKRVKNCKAFLKHKAYLANKKSFNFIFQRNSYNKGFKLKEDVKNFLEKYENSCLCLGKKDTLAINTIKIQKRFITNNLKILHKKFNETHPYVICFSTFCMCKPLWIMHRKVDARDT